MKINSVEDKDIEKKLKATGLLAMFNASSKVMNEHVMSTPLLTVKYDNLFLFNPIKDFESVPRCK